MQLRKKASWSQEELAEQLGVTRQSVSKWEGAQSLPDLEKILQMSRLFGVSTDFLLKDDLEAESPDRCVYEPDLETTKGEACGPLLWNSLGGTRDVFYGGRWDGGQGTGCLLYTSGSCCP